MMREIYKLRYQFDQRERDEVYEKKEIEKSIRDAPIVEQAPTSFWSKRPRPNVYVTAVFCIKMMQNFVAFWARVAPIIHYQSSK